MPPSSPAYILGSFREKKTEQSLLDTHQGEEERKGRCPDLQSPP